MGTGIVALQWKSLAPPFFSSYPVFGILVVAIVLVWVHFYTFPAQTRRIKKGDMPPLVRLGLLLTGISLFLGCIYLALFRFTTVADPLDGKRYQIGFGKMSCSLTSFAREYKNPSESIYQWMMQGAYFHDDGPRQLWTQSSILAASITLGTVFLLALGLLIAGWAMIAKHLALTEGTHISPNL